MKIRITLSIWLIALIALSISPLAFKVKVHINGRFHDFEHYLVYGLTAVLLWLITEHASTRVVSFFAGCALAYAQEWAENWIYHAGFEYKDVASDVAGLVTGFALMILITTLMRERRHY